MGSLPATQRRWESHLYSQPKKVLNLSTPEGWKAKLTYVTWKRTGWELNPWPVNRRSNSRTTAPPRNTSATTPEVPQAQVVNVQINAVPSCRGSCRGHTAAVLCETSMFWHGSTPSHLNKAVVAARNAVCMSIAGKETSEVFVAFTNKRVRASCCRSL